MNQPLVSIIIITYNSSKFILETLESARAQTYRNIELIVSDDCSTDDTVDRCHRWIEENKSRFVRTELITVTANTGIPANCNRGTRAAKGEWIKPLAGDDLLLRDSIRLLVNAINDLQGQDVNFLFGACQKMWGEKIDPQITTPSALFRNGEAKSQYYYLIRRGNCIQGPTPFLNRKKLSEVGEYDERIRFSEDWACWINVTNKGHKLYFIDDVVAYYRIHEDGIFSKTLLKHKYDPRLSDSVNLIRELYLLPHLLNERLYFDYWHILLMLLKERSANKRLKHTFYYVMQITDFKAVLILFRRLKNKFIHPS